MALEEHRLREVRREELLALSGAAGRLWEMTRRLPRDSDPRHELVPTAAAVSRAVAVGDAAAARDAVRQLADRRTDRDG